MIIETKDMNIGKESRKLADYILNLHSFQIIQSNAKTDFNHIGGLYTDVVLQSGLNYKSVVLPRVNRVLNLFPEAYTVKTFIGLIEKHGPEYVINWKHPVKLNRLFQLLEFSECNNIDNCDDLRNFFYESDNRKKFLQLNGFGPKTLDYCLKILNFEIVAVDRHIFSFVGLAGVPNKDYQATKMVVEFAADFLDISRSSMDYSIWSYMSQNGSSIRKQLSLFD